MSFTASIENRYRLMFRFYDLNNDGLLDRKDLEMLIDNVAEVYKTDAAEKVKTLSNQWCGMFEKLGLKGAITEKQFISAIRFLFEKDFEKFRKFGFKLYEANFSLIDHDKDNKISLDELVKYYACFNITDTDRVKKIFNKLDLDKSGFVSRDEWILARLDFGTRDDPDHDFGFMLDFSSPVPENNSSGRLTENLLKRYARAFRFFDVDKDGFHSLDDYLLICDNVCNLHNADETEKEVSYNIANEFWKQLKPMAIGDRIPVGNFLYFIITLLVSNFEKLRLDIMRLFRPWFRIADKNLDGLVSQDEFQNFYFACNVKNKNIVNSIFKKIDLDDDGFISEEEWILATLDYWTWDDASFDYGFLYDVDSPVPENNSSGRLTENLLKRYARAFRFFDVDKDGFHSLDDYLLICDNVCNLHNADETEKEVSYNIANEFWKQLKPMAIGDRIPVGNFLYFIITLLVSNFEKLRLDIMRLFRPWFRIADKNLDGLVSQDEFQNFYFACNVKNKNIVNSIFKKIDLDDDGFISEEEWILATLDYWTWDDASFDYGFLYDVE